MISESDKFLIQKLIDIRNRGLYANGRDVTLAYNRVFGANLSQTNCSSCIRTRINLLERELRRQEAEEAKALEEAQAAAENKEVKEERKEETENGNIRQGVQRKKRSGKKAVD